MTIQPTTATPVADPPFDSPPLPSPAKQRIGSAVALAAICGSLYYAAATLGLALRFPDTAVSALWPPNALLLATLLLIARRHWWIPLLAIIPAHFAAHGDAGLPIWRLGWQIGHNWTLAICAAWLLRSLVGSRNPFDTLRDVSIYLVVTFAAPALAALIAPNAVLAALDAGSALNEPAWLAWRSTYLSNAVAFLTLAPAMVLWASEGMGWLRRAAALRYAEAALIAAAICLVLMFIFRSAGTSHSAAALYALLVPLLWAAARFGVGGVASALFAITLIATIFASDGRSQFAASASLADVFSLQIFLLAIALPLLILAVLMDERVRRAEAVRDGARALRESQERYRAIVESQTELVCRYLPDMTLTFVNSAYCRFFNRRPDALIGRSFLDLVPEGSREAVRRHTEALAQFNGPVTNEHEVLLPDGAAGWQQWTDCAIYANDGSITEYQAIGRDITDLKRTEESLRHSDERFRLVLQATNDVIFDWDIAADALWWSANGERFFGAVRDGGLYNQTWWNERLHPDDRAAVAMDLQAAIDRGEDLREAEYRLVCADGAVVHIHERGFIVRDAGGQPLRMIGSMMDVTDRKRLQEANRTLARVARLAAVGEITASIAHEINQPLGAILNNAEAAIFLLEAGSLDEVKQILDDIRKDDLRASNVIRKLRGLLQHHELQRQPLNLGDAAMEVVSLVKVEAKRRRVAIETRFSPIPLIAADRVHLQQALLNLILNSMDALAHTPEPLRRIGIHVQENRNAAIELRVTDTGCGIAAERLPQLFDSFYTSKPNGMGLGLSIARSIIEAHGGHIRAENNTDGPGASFRIELPLGQPGSRDARTTGPRPGSDWAREHSMH